MVFTYLCKSCYNCYQSDYTLAVSTTQDKTLLVFAVAAHLQTDKSLNCYLIQFLKLNLCLNLTVKMDSANC